MTFLTVFFLLFLALIIAAIFSYGFNVRGPWGSFWTFFLVLFLTIWAADVWISPVGPYWGDFYWAPPLIVGLLIAFLLAAATPTRSTKQKLESETQVTGNENEAAIAIGTFFWIVMILLIAAVLSGAFLNV